MHGGIANEAITVASPSRSRNSFAREATMGMQEARGLPYLAKCEVKEASEGQGKVMEVQKQIPPLRCGMTNKS